VGRPAAWPSRGARAGGRRPARQAAESAFARLDRDPVEDYCLALLLQFPELREAPLEPQTPHLAGLRQEYFLRPENREILNHLAAAAPEDTPELVLASLQGKIDPELGEQLEALLNKPLPPLEGQRRRWALHQVAHQLEDRYLRGLKTEESLRFGDSPDTTTDLPDDARQKILDLNQRIKMNHSRRNGLAPAEASASPRGN
jgi:hypothetical protein